MCIKQSSRKYTPSAWPTAPESLFGDFTSGPTIGQFRLNVAVYYPHCYMTNRTCHGAKNINMRLKILLYLNKIHQEKIKTSLKKTKSKQSTEKKEKEIMPH